MENNIAGPDLSRSSLIADQGICCSSNLHYLKDGENGYIISKSLPAEAHKKETGMGVQ